MGSEMCIRDSNYIGAGLVLKGGTKIVRPIIIVVISLLFIKVIADLVM